MALELSINGFFEMTVLNLHTETPVEKDIELRILNNLQQGEYLIGMESRFIYDINDLQNPIYKFNISPTDNVSYTFDEQ